MPRDFATALRERARHLGADLHAHEAPDAASDPRSPRQ